MQLEKSFPEPARLIGHVSDDKEQEIAVGDSESSIQQIVPDIPSQQISVAVDFSSHHQKETIMELADAVIKPKTMESSNLSGSPDCDDVILLPETVSYPPSHSSEVPKEEEQENILEHENEISVEVEAAEISNDSSASSEERPTTESFEFNDRKDSVQWPKNTTDSAKLFKHRKDDNPKRGLVDTAAPTESVKEVVTKFGGIVDWKAHRAHVLEKHKHARAELKRIQDEISECKSQWEAAEETKIQVLKELESTKGVIEELKLDLERAEKEEVKAKQDFELATLRVEEMAQGIAIESSIAVKAQLKVAKERHEAAVAELKSVKDEHKALQGEYVLLIDERDAAMRTAQEVVSAAKEIEKTVEKLTLELITKKGRLEVADSAHHEAEEQRIDADSARDQDCLKWNEELNWAKEEEHQLMLTMDLKQKLDASTTLLHTLKAELDAYMRTKSESNDNEKMANVLEETNKSRSLALELDSVKKMLKEVKVNIEEDKYEANCLRRAVSSIMAELDEEKAALTTLKHKEGITSIAISSLEAELDRTKQELEFFQMKEKEAIGKTAQLPKLLKQAAQEADQAKSAALLAHEELRRTKEEVEQAKAAASTVQIKLHATMKETEAVRASENLAMAAVNALRESEQESEDYSTWVLLPLDEYFTLSKRTREAEELSHERVADALAQIDVAKKSELNSLERLEEACREIGWHKETLEMATAKAEKAQEGKLWAEHELRKWRAENERRRRGSDAARAAVLPLDIPQPRSLTMEDADAVIDLRSYGAEHDVPSSSTKKKKKKKKKNRWLFSRVALLFLSGKRSRHAN